MHDEAVKIKRPALVRYPMLSMLVDESFHVDRELRDNIRALRSKYRHKFGMDFIIIDGGDVLEIRRVK